MKEIDFSVFETKYWKPEDDKDYVVEIGNPRIEERSYRDGTKRWVIVHDLFSVNGKVFVKPLEFVTGSRSFIDGIKPLVLSGRHRYKIAFQRKNGKEYTVINYETVLQAAGSVN